MREPHDTIAADDASRSAAISAYDLLVLGRDELAYVRRVDGKSGPVWYLFSSDGAQLDVAPSYAEAVMKAHERSLEARCLQ